MKTGILTNVELIDSLIVDLNDLVRLQFSGQYVGACSVICSMTQKLGNLRKTIDNDLHNKDEMIKMLKDELKECGKPIADYTPEEFLNGTE